METPNRPNNDGIINTDPLKDGSQLLALISNVQKDWYTVMELVNHQGKLIHAKFESAKAAGFTEQQALQVCTQAWM